MLQEISSMLHWPPTVIDLTTRRSYQMECEGCFFFFGTKQQMKTWSTKTLHDLVEYSGAARQPLRSCTAHIHLMKTLTMAVHAKAAR